MTAKKIGITLGTKKSTDTNTKDRLSFSHPSDKMKFDAKVKNIVPENVFNWLEDNNWGDVHQLWHMARYYQTAGAEVRQWMRQNSFAPSQIQEGMPFNGVDFLAMHGSMIGLLKAEIGDVPLTNDPDSWKDMNRLLDGWNSDGALKTGLQAVGVPRIEMQTIERQIAAVNKFDDFASEDDFGLFLQTKFKFDKWITAPKDGEVELQMQTSVVPLAGIHAALHSKISARDTKETKALLELNNPRKNLCHIYFWRLHGWIQWKWQEYIKAKPRSPEDKIIFDAFNSMYAKHHSTLVCIPLRTGGATLATGTGGLGSGALAIGGPTSTALAVTGTRPRSGGALTSRLPPLPRLGTTPKVPAPRVNPRGGSTGARPNGCVPAPKARTFRQQLLARAKQFGAALTRLKNGVKLVGRLLKASFKGRAAAVVQSEMKMLKVPNLVSEKFADVAFADPVDIPCFKMVRGSKSALCPQGPDTLVKQVGSQQGGSQQVATTN